MATQLGPSAHHIICHELDEKHQKTCNENPLSVFASRKDQKPATKMKILQELTVAIWPNVRNKGKTAVKWRFPDLKKEAKKREIFGKILFFFASFFNFVFCHFTAGFSLKLTFLGIGYCQFL